MGAVEDMMCVVCVCVLQRVNSGDGCDLASTLCTYDFRKGYLFVLSWTSEAGKYLFQVTNMCWRCA